MKTKNKYIRLQSRFYSSVPGPPPGGVIVTQPWQNGWKSATHLTIHHMRTPLNNAHTLVPGWPAECLSRLSRTWCSPASRPRTGSPRAPANTPQKPSITARVTEKRHAACMHACVTRKTKLVPSRRKQKTRTTDRSVGTGYATEKSLNLLHRCEK